MFIGQQFFHILQHNKQIFHNSQHNKPLTSVTPILLLLIVFPHPIFFIVIELERGGRLGILFSIFFLFGLLVVRSRFEPSSRR